MEKKSFKIFDQLEPLLYIEIDIKNIKIQFAIQMKFTKKLQIKNIFSILTIKERKLQKSILKQLKVTKESIEKVVF